MVASCLSTVDQFHIGYRPLLPRQQPPVVLTMCDLCFRTSGCPTVEKNLQILQRLQTGQSLILVFSPIVPFLAQFHDDSRFSQTLTGSGVQTGSVFPLSIIDGGYYCRNYGSGVLDFPFKITQNKANLLRGSALRSVSLNHCSTSSD